MVRKLIKYVVLIFFTAFIVGCQTELSTDKSDENSVSEKIGSKKSEKQVKSELESRFEKAGLIDIQSLNANIFIDLKYASEDNFMHTNVYGTLSKAFLQPEIAEKVNQAQVRLTKIDSSLHLLIYDAARPRSVQQTMWNLLDTVPVYLRVKFVSNPKHGSIHNFGCAVDLTICNDERVPLDMGAGFDDARQIAYPSMESVFLESGELTKEQVANRKLLRRVMLAGQMWNIPSEWWHFNGLTRPAAKEKYQIIE